MLDCKKVEELMIDTLLEKKPLPQEVACHIHECPKCQVMFSDLKKMESLLNEPAEPLNTPPIWYFSHLVSTNKEEEITSQETILFFLLASVILGIAYWVIRLNLLGPFIAITSFGALLLSLVAASVGRETRD